MANALCEIVHYYRANGSCFEDYNPVCLYSSHGGFVVMSTLSRDAMAIYNIHTLKAILNNIEALR